LSDIGFERSSIKVPKHNLDKTLLKDYEETRNIPSIEGTSRLSPYLRFGTIGYRKVIEKALSVKNETFLDELIWREFYKAILYHYPETQDRAFKPKYDRIEWRNNEEDFEKWKSGQTGYPIVDAGMRQLNETGWMHNRLRMVVGSFLCKHLLIDWRWGEAYFAKSYWIMKCHPMLVVGNGSLVLEWMQHLTSGFLIPILKLTDLIRIKIHQKMVARI